jgi:hypothetical protein
LTGCFPTEPLTRRVAVLTRFFTHTDETDKQLDALVQAALGIMAAATISEQLAGHLPQDLRPA